MKYKLGCKYKYTTDQFNHSVYKSNDLPSFNWMEDNIGEHYVDWICYIDNQKQHKVVVEFKDEEKMVMFILRCGDNIEQM